MTRRFRKKPVVIEAIRWDGDWVAVCELAHGDPDIVRTPDGLLLIATSEGEMRARAGDWIIRGVKGEYYPCKPDIFEATYEPAAD